MNILLISATSAEIAPLTEFIRGSWQQESEQVFANDRHRITILTTGVGMTATTYSLTKALSEAKYDIAIQAGIGGSYDRSLALGTVVMVESELFADLGAEDHYNFLDVFELGFEDANCFPFADKKLLMPVTDMHGSFDLPRVTGLTVNTSSGSAFTALAREKKYGCVVESMEGAAFHYVCLQEGQPFVQVRSISNYVEARDRSKWKIKEAIIGLNRLLLSFLQM